MTAEEAQDLPEAASPTQDDPSIINRIVVLLTPLFALLAASVAAWVGKHIPGVKLDATQLTALIAAVATAALTMAVKWLHGWQQHEARMSGSGG